MNISQILYYLALAAMVTGISIVTSERSGKVTVALTLRVTPFWRITPAPSYVTTPLASVSWSGSASWPAKLVYASSFTNS